ncbi:MAG: hypothetical protein Q8O57_09230, partial [Kiritimatiellota bacterium]|nr:hypothetical protein [Kiritimatiellota bacterium]
HGGLPSAIFYPERPLTDKDSIHVLLGKAAAPFMRCPSAGPDFEMLGWPNYIWNSLLNGKKLADIKNPAETWLMMDFVAVHDWMVAQGHCGHRRGVNILYADGTVKWISPFEWVY